MTRVYTLEDCKAHTSLSSCWVVIHRKVYDVTEFLEEHPGGYDIILKSTGKDATQDYEQIGHGRGARQLLDRYQIGVYEAKQLSGCKMRSSKLFNSERFSDAYLQIIVEDVRQQKQPPPNDPAESGELGGKLACQYPVHQPFLAEASDYFAAFFESWSHATTQQGKPVVRLVVDESEVQLAHALVQHMYTYDLPQGLSSLELLRLIRMADQYDVTTCVEAAAYALSCHNNGDWDHVWLQELFQLPEALRASVALVPLFKRVNQTLLRRMSNFEEVWRSQTDEYHIFQQLPVQCVKVLLGSDQLRVSHENVVFAALADWVASNAGASDEMCAAFADELLPLVRLPLLGSSLMGQLWRFRCVSCCSRLTELLFFSTRYSAASADERIAMGREAEVPFGLTPRPRPPEQQKSITGDVALAALDAAHNEALATGKGVCMDVGTIRLQELDVTLQIELRPNGSLWCKLRWRIGAISQEVQDVALCMSVRWNAVIDRGGIPQLALVTGDSPYASGTPGESKPLELLKASDTPMARLRQMARNNGLRVTANVIRFE